jgi:hypothetical protein
MSILAMQVTFTTLPSMVISVSRCVSKSMDPWMKRALFLSGRLGEGCLFNVGGGQ